MTDFIEYGSKRIDFRLEYSDRRTLGITVTPDLEVLVKAPADTAVDVIKERLRKKAPWIIRQLSFFLSFQPRLTDRKFIGGETHLYLGKQYRLKVISFELGVKSGDGVKLKGQFLEVYTRDNSKVKGLVEAWYLDKAKERFHQLAQPLFEAFIKRNDIEKADYNLSIRQMPTRWGSCTAKGRIILNPELIKAPKACIEYVIVHELCHLIHHDHTQKFLDLQTREMAEWEKWKNKLERLLA
ncbi:MAG: SprT family zinc-dependent metalloprotease [Bacteroidales bacterium]|nr:SprT family zinc-dependent metalloprotease [Bacteroidales bacterium]